MHMTLHVNIIEKQWVRYKPEIATYRGLRRVLPNCFGNIIILLSYPKTYIYIFCI